MTTNCDVIDIFPIYGQFIAMRKPDSGRIVYKIYIFIYYSNLLSYKNWKQNYKVSKTALVLLLLVKILFLPKKCWFFAKEILTLAKLRGLGTKRYIFETTDMCAAGTKVPRLQKFWSIHHLKTNP